MYKIYTLFTLLQIEAKSKEFFQVENQFIKLINLTSIYYFFNLKHKTVWAPFDWPTIIACPRKNLGHLEVKTMTFNDFFDWKPFSVLNLLNKIVAD